MTGPLHGPRVFDFTCLLAGPTGAQLLGDSGDARGVPSNPWRRAWARRYPCGFG